MQVLKKNMDKRVLIVANTAYMIRQFNMNNIELLQNMGYQVEVACNFVEGNPISPKILAEFIDLLSRMNVVCHPIPVVKSLSKVSENFKAYRILLGLMKKNKYIFVHCQTPVGGALSRIAAHRTKTKVIYMVHGFHFHKESGFLAWVLYYPVEKLLSHITDILIVINQEDYRLAKTHMNAKRTVYIPGVGVDLSKNRDRGEVTRKELDIPQEAFLVLSVGELNKNKNHEAIIRAIDELPQIHYAIAGEGQLKNYLTSLAKDLGVADRVHFFGFRKDILSIYKLADLYCHPSYREGLSMAVMEAMAAGLPVVCSDIRGNRDLINDGQSGLLVREITPRAFAEKILTLYQNNGFRNMIGENALEAITRFESGNIQLVMRQVYNDMVKDNYIHA